MGFSFKKGYEDIVQKVVDANVAAAWQLSYDQCVELFKVEDKNKAASEIAERIQNLDKGSAEYYLGNMIVLGIVNAPSARGFGQTQPTTFHSDEHKAHYDLKKKAQDNIAAFIKSDEACQQLVAMERKILVTDKKSGTTKEVTAHIEPSLHMRGAAEILKSYDPDYGANGATAEAEEATAPAPQPQEAPAE
jgi:hypothetical protein